MVDDAEREAPRAESHWTNPNHSFSCPKHRYHDTRCMACHKVWMAATYSCTQCAPAMEVREVERYKHNEWAEANGYHGRSTEMR